MIRTLLLPAFIMLMNSAAFAQATTPAPAPASIKVGDKAPCVTENNLASDGTVTARSTCVNQTANQNLVLEFFGTWCEYCLADLPTFDKLTTEFAGKATFRIVGVDTEQALRDFFKTHDFSKFEVGFDPDAAAFDAFGLVGTPTLVVIGPDGVVKYIYVGEIDPADVSAVEKAIAN